MGVKMFKLIQYVTLSAMLVLFGFFCYLALDYFESGSWLPFFSYSGINLFFSLAYALVLLLLLYLFEALGIGRRRMLDLIFGFFISAVLVNSAVCITALALGRTRFLWAFLIWLFNIVAESVIGVIWIIGCHRIFERFHFSKQAVFIYGSREDSGEYTRVNNTINRYFKISTAVDYQLGEEHIYQVIGDSSVVFLGDIPTDIRNHVVKFCQKNRIECVIIPKISDIYTQNAATMQLNDKLLLQYPSVGISGARKGIKRVGDIVVSLILLGCFSPVFLVIAICIRHEDGGKILYRQDRVTLDGKHFTMYKFRSMESGAEDDGARLSYKGDTRVTKVGRVLRNIHFDELPQLVNVLRGEMSMVGPRPEREEFIDMYTERIPEFSERLKVKAGITGYAQVYGRYNTEPEDKIRYDLYYIYRYSIWLDIKLLILTFRILFQKENTEGVDEDQISALKERESSKDEREERQEQFEQ